MRFRWTAKVTLSSKGLTTAMLKLRCRAYSLIPVIVVSMSGSLVHAIEALPHSGLVQAGPTTKVVGVVVDETGKAVAGAHVNTLWQRKLPKESVTGADGSFHLELGPPMRLAEHVLATADDGARQGLCRFDEVLFGPQTVRIVLKPARTIQATVTDARGLPVAGAIVEVASLACGSLATALTDARGRARVRFVAEVTPVHVTALKPGVGFDQFENYQSWPPLGRQMTVPDAVALTLDGARSISILATDTHGRPLPGIPFVPARLAKNGKLAPSNLGGNASALATTGPDGVARFDWIPRRIDEPILFVCHSQRFATTPVYWWLLRPRLRRPW